MRKAVEFKGTQVHRIGELMHEQAHYKAKILTGVESFFNTEDLEIGRLCTVKGGAIVAVVFDPPLTWKGEQIIRKEMI